MADFYRGSTPTFIFTPTVDIPAGTPTIAITQGDTALYPVVTENSGQYSCTLTSAQSSRFNVSDPVIAQLYFTSNASSTYLASHILSVGENYYDFQEEDEDDNPDVHQFELVLAEPDDVPVDEGWYELINEVYTLTQDTVPEAEKEYYLDIIPYFAATWVPTPLDPEYNVVDDIEEDDSPALDGWYELVNDKYVESTDQEPVNGKTYYVLDEEEDFDDEYDEFAQTFDGDAFAADMDLEENWEEDLDEEDYDLWVEDEMFIEADNIDDFEVTYEVVTPDPEDNPSNRGWLEYIDEDYEFTDDEIVKPGKTYYDMIVEDPEEEEE